MVSVTCLSKMCVRALILRKSRMETGIAGNSLLKAEDTWLDADAIEMIKTVTIK